MAYKPPKQQIDNNDVKNIPSSEAIYEALKYKIDQPTISGTAGQLLQLDGYTTDPDGILNEPITSWVNPPASGANTTLSNLVAPTAVNQVLLGQDGAEATPAYSFTSSTNTGLFKDSSIANPTVALGAGGRTLIAGSSNQVRLGYTAAEIPGNSSFFDFANSSGNTYFRTRVGTNTGEIFTIQTGSGVNLLSTSRNIVAANDTSQVQWGGGNVGLNCATSPTFRRPMGIHARVKLTVGDRKSTIAINGGVLSTHGVAKFAIPGFTSTSFNDTTSAVMDNCGGAGNIVAYNLGIGDQIEIVKTGQPTIQRKIISVAFPGSSGGGGTRVYTLNDTVSSAYNSPTAVNALLPSFLAFQQDGTRRIEIDYDGNIELDSAVVINESGADKDTRIEGDTDANLVFVDASTDRVGIGTASPAEKLEVAGAVLATEYRVPNYRLDPHTHDEGTETTDFTINWSNGAVHTVTLNAAGPLVITMSNPVDGGAYALRIIQGATPGTVTWPANVKWPGGTPPTLSTNTGDIDVVNLLYFDDGGGNTFYYATSALAFA